MNETVECKYSKCLHDEKTLLKEEAIKSGNRYYHANCYKNKEDIKQIVDLFKKNINSNPVYSQLQNVINNIVFTRGLGSDLLLFGLKFYIENKIPLNYPQGLYYVIQNKEMIKAYNKNKVKNMGKFIEIESEDNGVSFNYAPTKTKGFEDILRG